MHFDVQMTPLLTGLHIYTKLSRPIANRQALMATQDSSVPFSSYIPRVAIVTGASQGIGQAIALRLADDGIDIAVNDIQSKQNQIDNVIEQIRKKGRRAIAIPGDVAVEADISAMVEKTAQELGGVDIMVANAGIAHISTLLETPTDKLDTIYAVNIRGVFLCLKYAGLQMVKQGRGGRLIGYSICGKQGAVNLSAYSASKFAVRGIVQSASMELRKYGIIVNAYAPGSINTAMLASSREADPSFNEASKSVPIAEPETIASIVSYIAKPESYFVNGNVLPGISRRPI
ncbi:NAD-binding protein [Fomitiporia mediterranea MF3/22]|uniref:NAD-binding protein n=1 Tax=Fomitiporia mediterranea (strain MF3/22) TaxID=694068 RepID=UPI0004407FF1|nr:NAD-binding protein [Fomitiporia mediterranea MF3/22]EJD06781.1 NAD-binding protein [Fomitiporia mediterranea MF3/22]